MERRTPCRPPSRSQKRNHHHPAIPPSPPQRGVGVAFGPDVAKRWLEANGLQMVVRSHEVRPGCYCAVQGGVQVWVHNVNPLKIWAQYTTGLTPSDRSTAAAERNGTNGVLPLPPSHLSYQSACRVSSMPLQVKDEGFEVAHDGYTITVFSAPNYCDQMVRPCNGCPGLLLVLSHTVFTAPWSSRRQARALSSAVLALSLHAACICLPCYNASWCGMQT